MVLVHPENHGNMPQKINILLSIVKCGKNLDGMQEKSNGKFSISVVSTTKFGLL
jgi:hypothetical protein